MKTLLDLYREHNGKASDKWSIYLEKYDQLFSSFRVGEISLLEIGVQNGGSLEIWGKYFESAKNIVGCDINEKCNQLSFQDKRIAVVVGDANEEWVVNRVLSHCSMYDIVIDDGSHSSRDIIQSFIKYFGAVRDNGLYVVEDLHCSYWKEYSGGLYDPYSSIAFFKKMVDVVNFQHWGCAKARKDLIHEFFDYYEICDSITFLDDVHSVEFFNSVCVIRKKNSARNLLGVRCVVGVDESVMAGNLQLNGCEIEAPNQKNNIWNALLSSPESQYLDLLDKQLFFERKIRALDELVVEKNNKIEELARLYDSALVGAATSKSLCEDSLIGYERVKGKLDDCQNELLSVYSSNSWKFSLPFRVLSRQLQRVRIMRGLIRPIHEYGGGVFPVVKKAVSIYSKEGVLGLKKRLRYFSQAQSFDRDRTNILERPNYLSEGFSLLAKDKFENKVVIIAELSIPQCMKYRVTQKKELFDLIDVPCEIANWTDTQRCIELLHGCSVAIFYRVPGFDSVLSIIDEAHRLGVKTYWEVDDLIFDEYVLKNSKTLARLDKPVFDSLIGGAALYKTAMLKCCAGIASTSGLAEAMRNAGLSEVYVIENALDQQSLSIAERLREKKRLSEQDKKIRIVYGSGTNTHNVDFMEASEAIANILRENNDVVFRVVGHLDLPQEFDDLADKIERIPICSYEEYLGYVKECDISIAPLENYVFNDSKSNIKYLEASLLGVPSVCSPRSAFSDAVRNNVNGFLCGNNKEWFDAIDLLVNERSVRENVAIKAHQFVLNKYTPICIAKEQVKCVINQEQRSRKRVLSVNCYYKPRTFGGATVVAEELNRRLADFDSIDVYVLTLLPESDVPAYEYRRYEDGKVTVFGLGVPSILAPEEHFYNEKFNRKFIDIVSLVAPDVVHFHCVQGLGANLLDICHERDIPFAVTLHDAWWLCGRQFMIDRDGRFCNQYRIEQDVCAGCVDSPSFNSRRNFKLRAALKKASLLLSPSVYFKKFYEENGFPSVVLNKNGIVPPQSPCEDKFCYDRLRFGYVSGNNEIKGFGLIKKAFSNISIADAKLLVVDNTMSLGFSSFNDTDVRFFENVEVVPAYDQKNIDMFFSKIDVLLFPTQLKESFGLVAREAISRNVWLIATEAGGVVEDVIDGVNGTIIKFDDDGSELLDAVNVLITKWKNGGMPKSLPKDHIVSFDDQARDLKNHLVSIIK